MHVTYEQNFWYFKEGYRNFINQYIHPPNTTYILILNQQLHSSAFNKTPSGCVSMQKGTNLKQLMPNIVCFWRIYLLVYLTLIQRDHSPENNRKSELHFDVITSFSAVYIWSWTTAHRDTRKRSFRTVTNDVTAGGGPLP